MKPWFARGIPPAYLHACRKNAAVITSIARTATMIQHGAVCAMRVLGSALAIGSSMMSLRDRIAEAIRRAAASQTYWVPGPYVAQVYADAVIEELIDMAGCGELLRAIDGTHR